MLHFFGEVNRMIIRIYALIDPRAGEVRYIGQTRNTLALRMAGHRCAVTTVMREWIDELADIGVQPEIVEIDEVAGPEPISGRWCETEERALEIEGDWALRYILGGADLLNQLWPRSCIFQIAASG